VTGTSCALETGELDMTNVDRCRNESHIFIPERLSLTACVNYQASQLHSNSAPTHTSTSFAVGGLLTLSVALIERQIQNELQIRMLSATQLATLPMLWRQLCYYGDTSCMLWLPRHLG
jgi:hypothetical protein